MRRHLDDVLGRQLIERRSFLQAGTIGVLGLSMTDVASLRMSAATSTARPRAVIFIFLTGGRAD